MNLAMRLGLGSAQVTTGGGGGGSTIPTSNGTSVTLRGITQGFQVSGVSTAFDYGTYADGIGVFVVAPGGVDFPMHSPAYTASPRPMNGAMKNPNASQGQGFDQYLDTASWTSGNCVTTTISMSPQDVKVICLSRGAAVSNDPDGVATDFLPVFCVSTAPPTGTPTPDVLWTTPATRDMAPVAMADAAYALAPRRSSSGLSVPSWASIKPYVNKAAFILPMLTGTATGGYKSAMPYQYGGALGNYGQYIAEIKSSMWNGMFLTDAYSAADAKEALAIELSNARMWARGFMDAGGSLTTDGAHRNWMEIPMLIAASLCSDTTMQTYLRANCMGNYLMGMEVTAGLIDQIFNTHSSNLKCVLGRICTVTAVTGSAGGAGSITFTYAGGPANWRVNGNLFKGIGVAGTAEADMAGQPTLVVSGSATVNVVHGATRLNVSDTFRMEPGYTLAMADPIFSIGGNKVKFTGSTYTSYIDMQTWTAFLAAAISCNYSWLPDFEKAIRYAIRANTANNPSAAKDFPGVNGPTDVGNFYTTHGATHFAAYLSANPDSTAPTISWVSAPAKLSSTSAEWTLTTNEANGGVFWVATSSSTVPSTAQILARQDHTGAAALKHGAVDITATGSKRMIVYGLTASTTYHIHLLHQDRAGNISSRLYGSFATDATGQVMIVDWDGVTVGSVFDTADTGFADSAGGWQRPSSNFLLTATSNANAPYGVSAMISGGTAAHYWGFSTASATMLASRTNERVQVRFRAKVGSSTTARAGIGYSTSTDVMTGVRFSASAGGWGMSVVNAGSPQSGGTGGVISPSAPVGSRIEGIFEVQGTTIKARAWIAGNSDPGAGSDITVTAGSDIAFSHLGLLFRTQVNQVEIEQMTMGIISDAPALL